MVLLGALYADQQREREENRLQNTSRPAVDITGKGKALHPCKYRCGMYGCRSSSDDKVGLGRNIKMITVDLVLEELRSSDGTSFFCFSFLFGCFSIFDCIFALATLQFFASCELVAHNSGEMRRLRNHIQNSSR